MSSQALETKKPHKLFGMIFSRRRTYEIINISDIIICILVIFIHNFIPYSLHSIIYLFATIVFLLISSVTFFTYFYYKSFGTKMHYAYYWSAVVFSILSIAVTFISFFLLFDNGKQTEVPNNDSV